MDDSLADSLAHIYIDAYIYLRYTLNESILKDTHPTV